MKANGKQQLLEFEARILAVGDSLGVIVPAAKRRGVKVGDYVRVAVVSLTQVERDRIARECMELVHMAAEDWFDPASKHYIGIGDGSSNKE